MVPWHLIGPCEWQFAFERRAFKHELPTPRQCSMTRRSARTFPFLELLSSIPTKSMPFFQNLQSDLISELILDAKCHLNMSDP